MSQPYLLHQDQVTCFLITEMLLIITRLIRFCWLNRKILNNRDLKMKEMASHQLKRTGEFYLLADLTQQEVETTWKTLKTSNQISKMPVAVACKAIDIIRAIILWLINLYRWFNNIHQLVEDHQLLIICRLSITNLPLLLAMPLSVNNYQTDLEVYKSLVGNTRTV